MSSVMITETRMGSAVDYFLLVLKCNPCLFLLLFMFLWFLLAVLLS